MKETIKDNGNIVTKEFVVGEYSKVVNVGSLEVILSKGEMGKVRIEVSDNLEPYISITTEGNSLVIDLDDNYNYDINHKAVVYVPVNEQLNEIKSVGAGHIFLKERLNVHHLKCSSTGAGNIEINIDANELELSLIGSGNFKAEGNSHKLSASITGSGHINAHQNKSEVVTAKISGAGDISVYASKEIKAKITGAGNIIVEGNPEKRDTSVLGAGNIEFR
ncbi:hypothetical protein RCZ01_13920 [Capnocytophaga felis]|uniref:Putative auto-transporter adhesin head GIN domain-containing protein n=2 Tax=Capnocytophaga felis TaxID=2267611 RepID=A0A5M4B9L2_9FLAO|nr:hypothetical protein RCZ01_13920 [Capnocytophaga felis]GET48882.1 hypothetical protein RCZ02_17130 [Capnocytophaga felis]